MRLDITFSDGSTAVAFGPLSWLEKFLWDLEDSGKAAEVASYALVDL